MGDEYSLGDLSHSAIDGPFGSNLKTEHYTPSGVRVIRLQNIGIGEFNDSDKAFISEEYFDALKKYEVATGDMLIASMGDNTNPAGRSCLVPCHLGKAIIKADCFRFRINQSLADPRYLMQFMNSSQGRLLALQGSHGQTRTRLNLANARRLRLRIPPLPRQREIANALCSIDDAITATRRVVEQLRRVRKALLADLLTHGPPGRHKKFKTVKGLGRIPAEWEVVTLGDVLLEPIKNGYSPVSPKTHTGWWVTTLSVVSEDGYRSHGVKPAPPDNRQVQQTRLVPGDILVSRSNTRSLVGLPAIYDGTPSPCSYSDLLMRVRVDERLLLGQYAFFCLVSPVGRQHLTSSARGTSGSMKKIDRAILEATPIPLPPIGEQRMLLDLLHSADNCAAKVAASLATLSEVKGCFAKSLLGQTFFPLGGRDVE